MPISYRQYIERDPAGGDRCRLATYRLEPVIDEWFDTATGKTVRIPSTTQAARGVLVSSSPIGDDTELGELDPREAAILRKGGWAPVRPILLLSWQGKDPEPVDAEKAPDTLRATDGRK